MARLTLDVTHISFATVVLFLKILFFQQDLDKPFTGGLGSYKLYVLVAHHVSTCDDLDISRNDGVELTVCVTYSDGKALVTRRQR